MTQCHTIVAPTHVVGTKLQRIKVHNDTGCALECRHEFSETRDEHVLNLFMTLSFQDKLRTYAIFAMAFIVGMMVGHVAWGQEPSDYRGLATSRTHEGRIIMAQRRRDEIAERLLQNDKPEGWRRFMASIIREYPETTAANEARLLIGGRR